MFCVRLCVASSGLARLAVWSLVGVRWPRSVEGALCLRRPVVGCVPLAAGKIANESLVVAVSVALGVPFCVRSWALGTRGRSRRTAPREAAARSAALT